MAGRPARGRKDSRGKQKAPNFVASVPCPEGLPSTRIELDLSKVPGCPFEIDVRLWLSCEGYKIMDCPLGNPEAAAKAVEKFRWETKETEETDKFGFSPVFDPYLVDACCRNGIFPMTVFPLPGVPEFPHLDSFCLFCPKLHTSRAVLDLRTFKPSKSAAKKAKHYTVTVNTNIADAIKAVVCTYGENWLCRHLQKVFTHIHEHPEDFRTRISTICVWAANDAGGKRLAACELGFSVGQVYTSLTGTCTESGAGSVQLAVLGCILKLSGFDYWDFGMAMKYKTELGAVPHTRAQWLELITKKGAPPTLDLHLPEGQRECACRDIFTLLSASAGAPCPSHTAKAAKLQKKEQKRQKAAEWREQHMPKRGDGSRVTADEAAQLTQYPL